MEKIKQNEAYFSKENFEKYIPQRINELTNYGRNINPDIVNEYPNDLEKAEAEQLVSNSISDEEKAEAMRFLIEGKLIYQFLFAGAATRASEILRGGAKYTFSIDVFWKNVENTISLKKEQLKKSSGKEQEKLKAEIEILEKSKRDFGIGDIFPLCLGAREICQYRIMIEKYSKLLKINIDDVLKKIYFFVHINENSKNYILEDFKAHNFFGFKKENIIFIVQDTFYGYIYKNGKLEVSKKLKRPFGHGYTLMQTVMKGSGFIINENGNEELISESPIEYVLEKTDGKARLMANANIDDLTKLTDLITDLERISLAIKKIIKGEYDVMIEGVWNKKGQKGGSWLRDLRKNKNVLVEGMCLKTPKFKKLFLKENDTPKSLEELPLLNKMSNFYKVESLMKWLPKKGLPNYLDVRDGILFLESVTGDITQIDGIKSCAFVKIDSKTKEPEEIKTFKDINDIYITLQYMRQQDKNKDFQCLIKNVI